MESDKTYFAEITWIRVNIEKSIKNCFKIDILPKCVGTLELVHPNFRILIVKNIDNNFIKID